MVERIKSSKLALEILFGNIKDNFQDFYITVDKERVLLNNLIALKKYAKMMKRGEVCFREGSKGFLITYGIHDKSPRKYIKILFDDVNIAKKLLRSFLYEYGNKEFFIKVKRTNPLGRIAQSLGFIFLGGRGTEILLMRKAEKIFRYSNRDKDEDYDNPRQY